MNVTVYKCFIASPDDTSKERAVCDSVFDEINRTLGEQLGFRVESKKWERDARPSFGEDGQAVITEQLLDNFQLFIGVMWNRFGTPTKRATSGTEEEFYIAYKKYIEESSVEILLYFNEENAKADDLDLEQVQKVRDFKSKVSELGSLYCKYNGSVDFEKKLKLHLSNYFIKTFGQKTNDKVILEQSEALKEASLRESISLILKSRLDESLSLFSNQPIVWLDPVISKTHEISVNAGDNFKSRVQVDEIVNKPESIIIKAPPQFGLTCLANYMVSEAWGNRFLWVYLDAQKVKGKDPTKAVEKELRALNIEGKKIDCIVLDAWVSSEPGSMKTLRNLCHTFKEIPIIVMQTIEDSSFHNGGGNEKVNRHFEILHLLALPRNQIRKVVSNYNDQKNIGDENILLNKVIQDLDVLNIHRTPVNCLTLLKVSEKHFDESPVNRTKMIEMVLFVLFDLDELPTYKVKPDLKDCEHVLGRFCEDMIRKNQYEFTREKFLNDLELYCKEKLLHLEIAVVFDVLYANNIIVRKEAQFAFRQTYWIYYFAARRMYHDKDFCGYILNESEYIKFPEIIEFYTGIDRNREDVLEILINDLKEACDLVEEKTGLTEEINPLKFAEWTPSQEVIEQMKDEISSEVRGSMLPEELKDQHADQHYNQLKPYNQSIQNILSEYSFLILIQKIRASSRALRNSDYVDPAIKRGLIAQIFNGWTQVSRLMFAMTPLLAKEGYASFDGFGFYLAGEFGGDDIEERMERIVLANPYNLATMFKDDLYSNKIGPLLFDSLQGSSDELIKHCLALLIIKEKPINWRKYIEDYLVSIDTNSFYLLNAVGTLRNSYQYDFVTDKELSELSLLIKMGLAKHEFKDRKPGMNKIKQVTNKALPKRELVD